jgi:hypothetical protein
VGAGEGADMDADAVEVIGGGNEEDISMNAATVDDGDDAIDDVYQQAIMMRVL